MSPATTCTAGRDCKWNEYCDYVISYCESCKQLCLPQRGLGAECDLRCADYLERIASITKETVPLLNDLTSSKPLLLGSNPSSSSDNNYLIVLVVVLLIIFLVLVAGLMTFVLLLKFKKEQNQHLGEGGRIPTSSSQREQLITANEDYDDDTGQDVNPRYNKTFQQASTSKSSPLDTSVNDLSRQVTATVHKPDKYRNIDEEGQMVFIDTDKEQVTFLPKKTSTINSRRRIQAETKNTASQASYVDIANTRLHYENEKKKSDSKGKKPKSGPSQAKKSLKKQKSSQSIDKLQNILKVSDSKGLNETIAGSDKPKEKVPNKLNEGVHTASKLNDDEETSVKQKGPRDLDSTVQAPQVSSPFNDEDVPNEPGAVGGRGKQTSLHSNSSYARKKFVFKTLRNLPYVDGYYSEGDVIIVYVDLETNTKSWVLNQLEKETEQKRDMFEIRHTDEFE